MVIRINLKTMIVQSKYSVKPIKYKEIKYEGSIETYLGTINAITKINDNKFAVACGKHILIIKYENNNDSNENHSILSLGGHSKNILYSFP